MRRAAPAALLLAVAACVHAPAPSSLPRPLFSYHVGFWVNLHERLYAESSPRARPPAADAPAAWNAALDLYRRRFADRSLEGLFAPELLAVRASLSATADDAEPALPPDLASALRDAAAVYRASRWEADARNDRAFIAEIEPLVAAHGDALARDLGRFLGVPWPREPIRVEVSALAGPVGAFTSDGPPRITIAGADPRHAGEAKLEILFHEASHVLDAKITAGIDAAAATRGKPSPPGLWHALLFFTAGELVARRLGPGYTPYAVKNGLYGRAPGWDRYERALRAAWTPWLEDKTSFDAALAALVNASE